MMGDYHVRFCERLAGETPACLLGVSLRVLREPDDGTQGFTTNTKEDAKDTKKADMVLYP